MASLTSMLDTLSTAEPPATCGITREVPPKPVLGPCGQVFDQDALARWRRTRDDCPACGAALGPPAGVDRGLAADLRRWRASVKAPPAVVREDVVVARGRPLGRGAHGVVKRAAWRGRTVAVKMVSVDDDDAAVAMRRELKALRALRHPNVVALLGAVADDDEGLLWAVLEFAPHGSLHRLLHKGTPDELLACFGARDALPGLGVAFWSVATDVAAAVAFLHRRKVVHGDIKSANVLLGSYGVAKISDFGLARVVGTRGFTRASSAHGGTAAYMAPELGDAGALDRGGESADVFAYAVLVAELLSGREPFDDARNEVAVALRVRSGERPRLPLATPPALRDALVRCWDAEAAARPDMEDLLLDVVAMSQAPDGARVPGAGDEVVTVGTDVGCRELSSVLAEVGLRDSIPAIREQEIDIGAARLMEPADWTDCGMLPEDARKVVSLLGSDTIVVRCRHDGDVVEVTASPAELVRDVKERLGRSLREDVSDRRLRDVDRRDRTLLRDDATLYELGIRRDANVSFAHRRSPAQGVPFKLFVRDLVCSSRILELTVESRYTLKALIHLALEMLDRSVEEDWLYRLKVFGASFYATEMLIEELNLAKEDTIMLEPRMVL